MIDAAHDVRRRLSASGLQSFVKTTGGKGLHVLFPLAPQADWDTVKAFAQSIATAMAASRRRSSPPGWGPPSTSACSGGRSKSTPRAASTSSAQVTHAGAREQDSAPRKGLSGYR